MPGNQTGVPMTYMYQGRQFVVMAVGGQPAGQLVAFALPSRVAARAGAVVADAAAHPGVLPRALPRVRRRDSNSSNGATLSRRATGTAAGHADPAAILPLLINSASLSFTASPQMS